MLAARERQEWVLVYSEYFAMARRARFLLSALLASAAAAGFVYVLYSSELRRVHDIVSRGSVMVNTQAGPLEYAEKRGGTPLLSIHGAGGGYDQGLANAADLVGEGYRIIAPSRFGYLRTAVPRDSSTAAQADAHAALLAELDVSKAIVMGISAGARSALELALLHPDRVAALILIVPGTYSPTSPVSVEGSRASRFVFWLVNNGADFVWWATERLAPSVLIRFVGVPPELVARASKNDRARIMSIVRNIQPLSLRFAGINIDSNPNLKPLPLENIRVPS